MKTKFYLIVYLGLHIVNGWAQNQNWIFGNGNWIEFKNNNYLVKTKKQKIDAYEVSASISNNNGELIMYSDSKTIWNAYDEVIENAKDLRGHKSATSMAIVRQPQKDNIYYIFTVESNLSSTHFLCYNVVDMSLNNGHGKVIIKNEVLHSYCDEKIAVTLDCNQSGAWIIAHIATSPLYLAYKLGAFGLETKPVISQINSSKSIEIELGYLKFSPDSKFIANAKCHARNLDLNQFDNSTGKIIPYDDYTLNYNYHDQSFYGLAFSPNGKILYCSCLDLGIVYQFDLSQGKYKWKVNPNILYQAGSPIGALQLTPMNTIWVAKPGSKSIHCIEAPNTFGFNCHFKTNSIQLNTYSYLGLPCFTETVDAYNSGVRILKTSKKSLTISPIINSEYYAWQDGTQSFNKTVYHSGLYVVKLYNDKHCLLYTDSIQVEFTTMVGPLDKQTIYACSNTQFKLPIINLEDTSIGIVWFNNNINNGLPSNGSGQLPNLIAPDVKDTIWCQFQIYAANNIRPAYARTLTLIIIPSIKINSIANQQICFNQLLSPIQLSCNYADAVLKWQNNSHSMFIADSGRSFIPSKKIEPITKDETNTIQVIAEHSICPSTETSFKIRLIAPIHIEPVRDVSICGNEQLKSLVFKSNKVNYPLQWQNTQTGLGIDSFGVDSLTQYQRVNPLSNIAGQIMVFNTNNGCPGDSIYFNIQINSLPVLKPIADTLICSRQIFNGIKAETAYANDSIVWQSVNTYLSPNKKGNNPLPAYYIPAQQQLQYDQYTFVAYNKQCVSDTITTRVYYQISPKVLPVAPPDICSGDWQKTITLKCSPSPAIAHWNTLNAELIQTNGSSSIPAYQTSKAFNEKEQIFIARAEYEACFGDTTHIKFNVHATPKALFTIDYPSAQEDIIQYAIQLNNQSIGADSYEWDFGDNTFNQGLNPTHVYEKNTSYTVQLYVQNNFACSDTMTQKTAIFNNNQFFIPNAFSPNGDQFNETIQIHGITNEASSFRIFNRWGELIYETQNNSPWDGNYQNQACMQGVYMYVANIQSKHKGPIELRGSLTLLK